MIYIIYLEDYSREIRQLIGYTNNPGQAFEYCRNKNIELNENFINNGVQYECEYSWDEVREI